MMSIGTCWAAAATSVGVGKYELYYAIRIIGIGLGTPKPHYWRTLKYWEKYGQASKINMI